MRFNDFVFYNTRSVHSYENVNQKFSLFTYFLLVGVSMYWLDHLLAEMLENIQIYAFVGK